MKKEELISILNSLQGETYVINIPTKKGLGCWEEILPAGGFTFLAQYDRYYNRQIEYRESEIGTFAEEDDADAIISLLYVEEFSIYTDYLPTKEELINMIRNRQVIINNHDILGVRRIMFIKLHTKRNMMFPCHRLNANIVGTCLFCSLGCSDYLHKVCRSL